MVEKQRERQREQQREQQVKKQLGEQQRVDQAIQRRDEALRRLNRHARVRKAAERDYRATRRGTPAEANHGAEARKQMAKVQSRHRRLGAHYEKARRNLTAEIRSMHDPRDRKEALRRARESHIRTHLRTSRSSGSKGVLGERLTNEMMRDQGFKFLGSADRPAHGKGRPQGIDSVWERNGKYFVIESKWNKARRHHTRDGKQASANWTMGRLESAVGRKKAAEISQRGYYVYEVRVKPDGTMQRRNITNAGNYRARREPIRRNPSSSFYPKREAAPHQAKLAQTFGRPAAQPQANKPAYGASVAQGGHRAPQRAAPAPVVQRQAAQVRTAPAPTRK